MMPPGGTYPQYNPPVCQACQRPMGGELERILNAQINQLLEQVNALNRQLEQKDVTIRNLQSNHSADETRLQEMQKQVKDTNDLASERWRAVAYALDCALPEQVKAGLEYMGKPQYTAEYIIRCATELRTRVTMAEEASGIYKGQLLAEREAIRDHARLLTKAAVEQNLKQIEAAKESEDGV